MKTKIMLVMAVVCLALSGCGEKKPAQSGKDGAPSEAIEKTAVTESAKILAHMVAMGCMTEAKDVISADYYYENAKQELASQTTAGEAALKTMELQDAKAKVADQERVYQEKLAELREQELGIGRAGLYSDAIDKFCSEGRHHVAKWKALEAVRGFQQDDPDYEKFMEIQRTSVDDLVMVDK